MTEPCEGMLVISVCNVLLEFCRFGLVSEPLVKGDITEELDKIWRHYRYYIHFFINIVLDHLLPSKEQKFCSEWTLTSFPTIPGGVLYHSFMKNALKLLYRCWRLEYVPIEFHLP
jgi:hypothetical protein